MSNTNSISRERGIIPIAEFSTANDIQLGPVKQGAKGGNMASIMTKTSYLSPVIKLVDYHACEKPLRMPFGLKDPFDEATKNIKDKPIDPAIERKCADYSVPKDSPLHQKIRSIDADFIETAKANAVAWFPALFKNPAAPTQRELETAPLIIESSFYPSCEARAPKNVADTAAWYAKNYDPTLRTKANIAGKTAIVVYLLDHFDDERNPVCDLGTWRDLLPFVETIPIVELSNVWFMGKSDWGLVWQTKTVIVYPKQEMSVTVPGLVVRSQPALPPCESDGMLMIEAAPPGYEQPAQGEAAAAAQPEPAAPAEPAPELKSENAPEPAAVAVVVTPAPEHTDVGAGAASAAPAEAETSAPASPTPKKRHADGEVPHKKRPKTAAP